MNQAMFRVGTRWFCGADAVDLVLSEVYDPNAYEGLRAQVLALSAIVGDLLETLPKDRALRILNSRSGRAWE